MTKRKNISSGSPYEKAIGFSRAVRIGNRIVVSGTAPIAPDGSTTSPGDPYKQTVRSLDIIRESIVSAGGSLKDIIRTRIYLIKLSDWEEIARAHGEFFGEIRPAATMIQVKGLIRDDWLVEIEAECLITQDESE